MQCDFCSDPNVRWEYPCYDYAVEFVQYLTQASREGWAACDECHKILSGDRPDDITERSLSMFPIALDDGAKRAILHMLTALHAGFFELRKGPPVPYTP